MSYRVTPSVTYDDTDITEDISPYLKEIRFTDELSGRADDLEITLEDRAGLWRGAWSPEKGAWLRVSFLAENGQSEQKLDPGVFELDEVTCSGYPSEAKIRAVSVPDNSTLRADEHSRSWEETDLKTIASDLVTGNGMELFWDADDNPSLDRAEQTEEGDLSFLLSLCEDHGLALKVSDKKAIIFDEARYEQAEPEITIVKPGADYVEADGMTYVTALTSWTFTSKLCGIYAAAHVSYQESKKKQMIEATFAAPNKTGKTLQIKEQVRSIAEAETLAKKRLREANKNEFTGSISMPGVPFLAAGQTVKLLGFGDAFDAAWLITQVEHSLGSGGYATRVQVRKCLDGY